MEAWHNESKGLEAVDMQRDQVDDMMEAIFLLGFSAGIGYVTNKVTDGLARDAGIEVTDE